MKQNSATTTLIGTTLWAAVFATFFAVETVSAQGSGAGAGVYLSGAERIDVSDRIRTQSQRVAVISCLIDAGIDAEAHRATLTASLAEVDKMLAVMNDGDAALGITVPEDDRRMLAAIRGIKLQWDPFKVEAQTRLGTGTPAPGPDFVSRQNLNLMHVSKNLISETINHYSIPPALLQLDAYTLQIVARQRALSQQIAKEACGILTGNPIMGNQPRLTNAIARFDASFNALLNGFPAAGVSAPATPEIKAALSAMSESWGNVKAELAQVTPNGGAEQAQNLFRQLDSLRDQYDDLVPNYVVQSKSGI